MLICERRVEPQKEEKPGGGGFPCTGCLRPRALALKAPWGGQRADFNKNGSW